MPPPLIIALTYFGVMGCFFLAYYIAWQQNPDSFIVHQEMNVRPLAALAV